MSRDRDRKSSSKTKTNGGKKQKYTPKQKKNFIRKKLREAKTNVLQFVMKNADGQSRSRVNYKIKTHL